MSPLSRSLKAGALGFSTSRTILHRDAAGTLTPGTLAEEKELLAMAEAVRKAGGGVFELAQDFSSYDDIPYNKMDKNLLQLHRKHEWEWMKKVARHYKLPVSLSLAPPNMPVELRERSFGYREILTELENAREEGLEIYGQVFIRPQGILSNFESKVNPFRFSSTYSSLFYEMNRGKDGDAFHAALKENKEAVIKESIEILNGQMDNPLTKLAKMLNPFETMYAWQPTYEPDPNTSLLAIAERNGQHPLEVAFDLLAGGQIIWRASKYTVIAFNSLSRHVLANVWVLDARLITDPRTHRKSVHTCGDCRRRSTRKHTLRLHQCNTPPHALVARPDTWAEACLRRCCETSDTRYSQDIWIVT